MSDQQNASSHAFQQDWSFIQSRASCYSNVSTLDHSGVLLLALPELYLNINNSKSSYLITIL